MKNLICFPHYTAGGLLCDIFTDTLSPVGPGGGINSTAHALGKIGDADSVLTKFDIATLFSKIEYANSISVSCIGTHCWPGILDASQLAVAAEQIIIITTTTYRSKLY
ncbi:MAG: hypothetical protein ACOYKR_11845, partial [Sphingobacterium thalpophilum]